MKALHAIAFILVIVGAINWGLVGAGEWNVVNMLLGKWAIVERIVYILVGLSGILLAVSHRKDCKSCESAPVSQAAM
jgi:uncharacterized protein